MEYLEKNLDWLLERLSAIAERDKTAYFLFDTPGQAELFTTHNSLRNIVLRLTGNELGWRVNSRVNRNTCSYAACTW